MDQDPYARFVELGRRMSAEPPMDFRETSANTEGAAARLREGIVDTVVPLSVKVAGLEQPAKALRINERLTKGAKWRGKIDSKQPDFRSSTSRTVADAEFEQLELDLEAGDRVLLLTCDDQVFYIVMKVVNAG